MSTFLIILLAAIGVACFAFVLFIVIIASFIYPRLAGSITVAKVEGEQSLCVIMDDEKDLEKLQKYSYIVLRSRDYNPQK